MPIRFSCTSCNSLLSIASRKGGQNIACPKCEQRLNVPRRKSLDDSVQGEVQAVLPPNEPAPIEKDWRTEPPPLQSGSTNDVSCPFDELPNKTGGKDDRAESLLLKKISFSCPNCKSKILAPKTMSGKGANCPKCKKELQIPSESTLPIPEGILLELVDDEPSGRVPKVEPPASRLDFDDDEYYRRRDRRRSDRSRRLPDNALETSIAAATVPVAVAVGGFCLLFGLWGHEQAMDNLSGYERHLLHHGFRSYMSEESQNSLAGFKFLSIAGAVATLCGAGWSLMAIAHSGMKSSPMFRVALAVAILVGITAKIFFRIPWL